ncbi:hypothetical protein C8Q80DRAFT_306188 [Daedaleopsis nitida]|nr:hypothetical protein C8Q80DRAFT_306188 [Daedaleopsis nitida]
MPTDAVFLSMKLQPVPTRPSETREAKRERALARKARRTGQPVKKPKPAESKKPRALKGRAGRLAELMSMPKDIFYEVSRVFTRRPCRFERIYALTTTKIVSWLKPLDLLQLSRSSKYLRSLIMVRDNSSLWKAARKNVPGLPDCPTILAEPRYAAVLFDQYCFACGIPRSSCVDFSLALRFCGPCFKTNIRKGKDIRFSDDAFHDDNMDMMWSLLVAVPIGEHPNEDPTNNHLLNGYYMAEFDAVLEQLNELCDDSSGTQRFIEDRQEHTRQMQEHGLAVSVWYQEGLNKRYMDGEEAKVERKQAINDKLSVLGYSEDDYPRNEAWDKIFDQRTKLTERIWKNIRPKLEELLETEKNDRIAAALRARVKQRRKEIHVFYQAFVNRTFADDERAFLPNLCDAGFLPSATELATANDAQDVITEEQFAAIEERLLVEVQQHAEKVQRVLYKLLVDSRRSHRDKTPIPRLELAQLEVEVAKASALFVCQNCEPRRSGHFGRPLRQLITYSAAGICAHWRETHPLVKWTAGPPPVESVAFRTANWWRRRTDPSPRVMAMRRGILNLASDAVKALGLPEDTTYAEMDELVRTRSLVCLCGDPTLPAADESSWAELVDHIWFEQEWYRRNLPDVERSHHGSDLRLLDDHELTEESSCLKILAEGEVAIYPDYMPSPEVAEEIKAVIDASGRNGIGCRLCCKLHRSNWRERWIMENLRKDVDMIAHHVKTKHGKNLEKKHVVIDVKVK